MKHVEKMGEKMKSDRNQTANYEANMKGGKVVREDSVV